MIFRNVEVGDCFERGDLIFVKTREKNNGQKLSNAQKRNGETAYFNDEDLCERASYDDYWESSLILNSEMEDAAV